MIHFKTNLIHQAYKKLQLSKKNFLKLLNLKRGYLHASMKTEKLHCITDPAFFYKIFKNSLQAYAKTHTNFTQLDTLSFTNSQTPPHLMLSIDWQERVIANGAQNNILGGNGQVLIAHEHIHIPAINATPEYLAFYQAYLVEPDEYIQFSDPPYPIWKMKISKNYVKKFLMSSEGGGFYLEYHHDVPHYHQNIQGEGYYILGKVNSDFTKIQLTAFKIPKGYAIYTAKGAIHCDAALTGEYLVGYHLSKNYSTVLLRQKHAPQHMVQVFFDEPCVTN